MTVVDTAYQGTVALIKSLGTSEREEAPQGAFALDFNNVILGGPYIDGTGWLADKETAQGVAAIILPILNDIGAATLHEHPDWGSGWTDPEGEAVRSWATLVSLAYKEGTEEPAVEENFEGDVWFVVSVELDMLSDEQRRMLDKVRAAMPTKS